MTDYNDLDRLGSHIRKHQPEQHRHFNEHTKFEGHAAPGASYRVHGEFSTKKKPEIKPGFHVSNIKARWQSVKEHGSKLNAHMQKFGEKWERAEKNVAAFERHMGYGQSHSSPSYHKQQQKQPGQHIYVHMIQEKGGGQKKHKQRSQGYDDYLMGVMNRGY